MLIVFFMKTLLLIDDTVCHASQLPALHGNGGSSDCVSEYDRTVVSIVTIAFSFNYCQYFRVFSGSYYLFFGQLSLFLLILLSGFLLSVKFC